MSVRFVDIAWDWHMMDKPTPLGEEVEVCKKQQGLSICQIIGRDPDYFTKDPFTECRKSVSQERFMREAVVIRNI